MAPVIVMRVLAQDADVEGELWLVSACCRHTHNPGSEDPRLPHVAPSTSRHPVMAEGFELLPNDPDDQPALFPPKQTSPLSRKTLMEGPCAPAGGSGAGPGTRVCWEDRGNGTIQLTWTNRWRWGEAETPGRSAHVQKDA